jgi:glycosyltransferase involved in cell wall biosynthesis
VTRPVSLAIVQPAMAPYRFAGFSALAARPDVELLVIYLSRGIQSYDWPADEASARFPRVVLGARSLFGVHPFPRGLSAHLRRFHPQVTIVGGWDEPAYYAIAASGSLDGRLVVWTESTPMDRRRPRPLADRAKRILLHRADGVLVPGSAARAYAGSLGVPVRWFEAPNVVDIEHFSTAWNPQLDRRGREGPSPEGAPMVLYVGRLDREKGVDVLLRAWAKVEQRMEATLVVAGTGRLEAPLKALARDLGLSRVRFVGFVPQADLPAWYRRASFFVFPSTSDPWGMVINEAMACGLPVVTTSAPGAAADLVRDGQNGRVVRPHDETALAAAIDQLASNEELRLRMGRASLDSVADYTPRRWAAAVAAMAHELR